MNRLLIKSDALLLLTALIWGFAFVAQRVGMNYVGPFTFNGIRFALGIAVLIPLLLRKTAPRRAPAQRGFKDLVWSGSLAGIALFTGASLQQAGLVYTTAGNAGFITGLYVVMVPLLGLVFGHRPHVGTWLGAVFAAIGLYLLSVTEGFSIAFGDFLVLLGAFFWAVHVLIIGWLSPRSSALKLAFVQYTACSALSLVTAAAFEEPAFAMVLGAAVPLLYGGALSVGVAYTLQVVGQQHAHPAHAAILMSLEAVFAAVGGWLLLGEVFTPRELFGCGLMLTGMLVSQLWAFIRPGVPNA